MLTTTNNARFHFLRKVLVLPITFATIFTLSVSARETTAVTVQQPEKPNVKNDTTPILKDTKPDIVTLTADTIHINANKPAKGKKVPANVLYVLNGKSISAEEVSHISPGLIRSISILKDKAATDKYGQAGANGVVEIFLKELTLK